MPKKRTASTKSLASGDPGERISDVAPHRIGERLQIAEQVLRFGTWDWDLVSGELAWTPELETIYGLKPGGFGRSYADFASRVHPRDLRRVEQYRDDAVAAGRSFDIEFRIIRPDGELRWVRSKGTAVRDAAGKAQRVVGINIDITEDKTIRLALSASEGRLRAALKLSDLVIFHQDRQLRYTWIANPALGTTADGLIGSSDDQILGAESARPLTTIKRRVLRTGHGERQEVWVTKGDQAGCFDLIVEPERGSDGRITGVVCAAADITQRKRAEEQRDAAYRTIGDLADHVQDEMEEQRRELAREVHDQIGATLTGIRMRLETMLDSPRRDELLSIRAQIDHALATTRDLCTQLRPPMLDDLGLAETLRWYVRDWAQQTRIRTTTRIAVLADEPADPLRTDLFRMLQEILTNVARHAGARRVGVSLVPARHGLQLRVRDDGHGFRVDQANGFGLLGIRERLRRHGGQMRVDSTDRGTRVTLTIPAART